MKRILFVASFAAILAACGGQAQAQDLSATLAGQVAISPTKTVDITTAREIGMNPGNQYVIDRTGVRHPANFGHPSVIYLSGYFAQFAQYAPGVFRNVTQTNSIECSPGGSLTTWANGAQEVTPDGCAFSDSVKARARRG